MEIILILAISNILVVLIVFTILMLIMKDLSAKFLQIEIIKKADTFEKAEDFGKKDIKSMQNFDATITDVQEKAFLEAQKKRPSKEEIEASEWQEGIGK